MQTFYGDCSGRICYTLRSCFSCRVARQFPLLLYSRTIFSHRHIGLFAAIGNARIRLRGPCTGEIGTECARKLANISSAGAAPPRKRPGTRTGRGGRNCSEEDPHGKCQRIAGGHVRTCARSFDPCHGGPRYRESRRSEEHTSELQSLMRISYAVFCLKKKNI